MPAPELLVTWGLFPIVLPLAAGWLGCRPGRADRFFMGCGPLVAFLLPGLALRTLPLRGQVGAGVAIASTVGFALLALAVYLAFAVGARRLAAPLAAVMTAMALALALGVQLATEAGWGRWTSTAADVAVAFGVGWGVAWLLSRLRGTARRDPGPPTA